MLKRIRSTGQLADGIIQSIRRISTELRPAVLDLGLAEAVEWQVQEFQARSGIQCTVRPLTREVVASNASTAMFRIFQETLTNVARHAKATRAEVVLQKERDRLVLLIRDNGQGFDQAGPSLSKSLGLLGMRERAAILGGRVNISSAPGKGTTVTAWIPLPSPEESSAMPAMVAILFMESRENNWNRSARTARRSPSSVLRQDLGIHARHFEGLTERYCGFWPKVPSLTWDATARATNTKKQVIATNLNRFNLGPLGKSQYFYGSATQS